MRKAEQLTDCHIVDQLRVEAVDVIGDTVHVQFINGGRAQFPVGVWLSCTRSTVPNWRQ